jgi:thymidylate kinase
MGTKRGLTVALLAPDGAGKTRLAESLGTAVGLPARSVYMGLYQQPTHPSRWSRLSRALQRPGIHLLTLLLTQWQRYLIARLHKALGRLVIFDRYSYDALVSDATVSWRDRASRWLLSRACPAPDLVLVLDAPGEVLYARKREHTPRELERQRQLYLRLAAQLPGAVVIDAARDFEEVRREAAQLILASRESRESSTS